MTVALSLAPAAVDLHAANPFDLADDAAYRRWRAWKLAHSSRDAAALQVPVADLRALSAQEKKAVQQRIARHGIALVVSPQREADPGLPRRLGEQFGLTRLDANWLADEDGISSITVNGAGDAAAPRADFIAYTDRAIGWHTDGYYHPEARRIVGMILHCVRPAARGGETSLLDPALAYIALRDESPALLRALMHPEAMAIPAREDESGVAREEQSGPVFNVIAGPRKRPRLHLRYTARTKSIRWRDDAATRAAVARLVELTRGLDVLRLCLQPGMALVGDNVLHARSAFADDPASPRLLYRARWLDPFDAGPEEDAWRSG